MDIIKKLFCFGDDESGAIGLCKFNDGIFKETDTKEQMKKVLKKDASLTQILKRSY